MTHEDHATAGMVQFVVLGLPATKGSTRSFVSKGRMVTLADNRRLPEWTQAVGWAARAARIALVPRPGAVRVSAAFEFVRPASAKRRAFPTVKPDADKTLRALLDALTGVAWEDDAQVVDVLVSKRYGPQAQTTITVETVAG